MKGIFRKLGFHKMDEMERHILFTSQRNSYLFLIGALLVWSLYERYKVYTYHTRPNLLPSFLLVCAVFIQSISQLIMSHFAAKDGDDSHKTTHFPKTVIIIGIIVCVIIAIITTKVFMSVRI